MKTTRIITLAALAAISLFSVLPHEALAGKGLQTVVCKPSPIFGSFRTHKQGKGITASWTLVAPDGVAGFTVQRTYEDPTDAYAFWENVGSVAFNNTRSFTYTDSNVFPGTISYRIVALMTDGTTSTSDVVQERIVSRK
jgi:hypothetical protein